MFCDIKQRLQKKISDEAEVIRLEASTIHEVVDSLVEMLGKYGIDLVITQYPDSFSEVASNSHYSPIGYPTNWCLQNKDEVQGYPAWTGRWEGYTIVPDARKVGQKDISLSDLRDIIPWLSCGGGGSSGAGPKGACGWQYGGELWIYDFPKMNAEYEMSGGTVKDQNNKYKNLLDAYLIQYEEEKNIAIREDPGLKKFKRLEEIMNATQKQLYTLMEKKTQAVKDDFNKEYGVDIPRAPSAFLCTDEQRKAYTARSHPSQSVHPDCKKIFTEIANLVGDMEEYRDDNPEIFI
jgi:hypothetical protein